MNYYALMNIILFPNQILFHLLKKLWMKIIKYLNLKKIKKIKMLKLIREIQITL